MKYVIKKYVERLTIDDINTFIKNNNYNVSSNEISIIYKYIKNYWEDILDNNTIIINKLKTEISESTYIEIINLINKYKKYIY